MQAPQNTPLRVAIPIAGAIAVIAVAGVLTVRSSDPSGPARFHGKVDRVLVYEADGRSYVSAVTHGTKARVHTWDLATGQPVAEGAVGGESFRLLRPVGSRSWGVDGQELALVDLPSAKVLVTTEDLEQVVPDLAGGYALRLDTVNDYTPPMPGVQVLLHDGRLRWIDMGALGEAPVLATTPPPTEPWKPGYFCDPEYGAKPSCQRQECLAWWPTEGSTAMVLGSRKRWGDRGDTVDAPRTEGTPLLRPGLVKLLETECAFEAGTSVLAVHDSAALDPKETLFSLLDQDGKALWTVRLDALTDDPTLEPFGAALVGDRIVLALTRHKESLVIARLHLDGTPDGVFPLLR